MTPVAHGTGPRLAGLAPQQRGQLHADKVEPLLDVSETVVNLTEATVNPQGGLVEPPLEIPQSAALHIQAPGDLVQASVMLAAELNHDADVSAENADVGTVLVALGLGFRHGWQPTTA